MNTSGSGQSVPSPPAVASVSPPPAVASVSPPPAVASVTVLAQALLLTLLAATVGLGPAGWITGGAVAAGSLLLLGRALHRSGRTRLGPADHVTLVRVLLTGAAAALVADALAGTAMPVPALVLVVAAGIVLDGVDGHVARRTGTVTELGARFDVEVDSALVLVLSVHVATMVGPWALAIGLMRYVFVLAGRRWTWLQGALPARFSAKAVAVLQGVALIVAAAAVLPHAAATALVGAALAALCWSFGRDVVLLHRTREPVVQVPEQRRRTAAPLPQAQLTGPPAAYTTCPDTNPAPSLTR